MQVFFSQGIAVLFEQSPDLGSLRNLIERHGFRVTADEDATEWPQMQGACLTLATDFESSAVCWVDICEFPWPDDMGTSGEPTLVTSAHALGAFGPFVYPGALDRALQAPGYQAAAPASREHQAFVRLRVSHFFNTPAGSEDSRPSRPENARPTEELGFLLRAAAALVESPGAIAYFNPNSEMILPLDGLDTILSGSLEHKTYPVEAVCRLRGCPIDDQWSFVDCIGMEQLGMRDHEFAWADATVTRSEQIDFLISLLHYQVDNAVQMATGHTTNGPHETLWRAKERETACMMPPRQVVHWTIDGAPPEPESLATAAEETTILEPASGIPDEAAQAMAEMAHKLGAWQGMRESIRTRAVQWMRSPAFLSSYYDDAHAPLALKVAMDREMPRKKASQTWQTLQAFGIQTPQLWQQYQQLAAQGQILFAVPLMTNPSFKSTPDTLLPCAVLVATSQTSEDMLAAGIFATLAYDIYVGEGDAKKFPGTAKIMENDSYRLFHREIFPVQETHGRQLVLFNIMLRKSWMPPEDVPFIPLLAAAGPTGPFVQIPWYVAIGGPPPLGPVQKGQWAELAELDREADKIMASQSGKKSSSCFGKFMIAFLIFSGIFSAVKDRMKERDAENDPTPVAPAVQAPERHTVSNVKSWAQPSEVRLRTTVAKGEAYQPLIGDGLQGSGFLFKTEQGFILAASSRHQFDSPDLAPSRLIDIGKAGDLTASLNTEELIRQPDSQIQLVTALSAPASCLEYQSADVLKHGDLLRLILDKGKWIEGKLMTRSDVPLSVPSVLLRMRVQTNEKIAGSSGSPIVHAQTGRVVGVMLGADKAEAPTFLLFETLRVALRVKK